MKPLRLLVLLALCWHTLTWADDMVLIPAGEFILGSQQTDAQRRGAEFGSGKPWFLDEQPRQRMRLPAYYIDRFEVTNAQYRRFLVATGRSLPSHWLETGYAFSLDAEKLTAAPFTILLKLARLINLDRDIRHMSRDELLAAIQQHFAELDPLPVNFVTWHDAEAYCHWAGKRLPTEFEWEKAARGPEGLEFPWGNQWREDYTNASLGDWPHGTAPVGSHPKDRSPYGVFDLAGNVSEWTASWYLPYPGSRYQSPLFGEHDKVARGGGWSDSGHYALAHFYRAAYRLNLKPNMVFKDVGFRCARDATAAD